MVVFSQPPQPAGLLGELPVALKCPEKRRLRRVFRVRHVAEQADGGGEHHVLIPPHERLKRFGVGHARDVAHSRKNPGASEKFQREASFSGNYTHRLGGKFCPLHATDRGI